MLTRSSSLHHTASANEPQRTFSRVLPSLACLPPVVSSPNFSADATQLRQTPSRAVSPVNAVDLKAPPVELTLPTQLPHTGSVSQVSPVEYETDPAGLKRLKYNAAGWNYWQWEGRRIHFVRAGPTDAPVVVLVHGYGASSYHWRYNVPALADAGYQVYAIDLLGFGYSEKALTDYSNGRVWVAELASFLREVVGAGQGGVQPAVLAGNSLGGYAALATAADHPELVSAVALLNGAGPFDDQVTPEPARPSRLQTTVANVKRFAKRVVMQFAFVRAKQPARIEEVLRMVYARPENVDSDLITSIVNPALDPAASEVFFLVSENSGPPLTVNTLLSRLRVPLLLLWGDLDPWITPAKADKVQSLYPAAQRVRLQAGHCPHDDTPKEANAALLGWLQGLDLQAKA